MTEIRHIVSTDSRKEMDPNSKISTVPSSVELKFTSNASKMIAIYQIRLYGMFTLYMSSDP